LFSLRQQRDYYRGITDTVNFKKYINKLTSSIRTSKAIYFSEAIKSGNNVGELWKHLKEINSVSKCHIKYIHIDSKKCDNIEDIWHSTLNNKEFRKIKESIVCFPGYPVSTPWQSNKQIRIEQWTWQTYL
jgi:hypothetical protein